MKRRLLLVWLSLLWAQAAVAASPIVDGQYVAEAIARNAIVWDVRPANAYAKGHIAGAISIGDATKVLRDENTEDFIATERIEKILGTEGLDPKREIIVYGSRGSPNAYFGFYTLQYFGSNSVRSWTRAPRRSLWAKISAQFAAVIFRAQSTSPTNRTGPIPKLAPSLPANRSAAMPACHFKSVEALKRLYSKLDPNKETIVYCQSGTRPSETAGVLQHLGFTNVKVYDSSWLGYGNTLDAPADNVTFFNVGLLNSRISALQDRINQLETELAEAKAKK